MLLNFASLLGNFGLKTHENGAKTHENAVFFNVFVSYFVIHEFKLAELIANNKVLRGFLSDSHALKNDVK